MQDKYCFDIVLFQEINSSENKKIILAMSSMLRHHCHVILAISLLLRHLCHVILTMSYLLCHLCHVIHARHYFFFLPCHIGCILDLHLIHVIASQNNFMHCIQYSLSCIYKDRKLKKKRSNILCGACSFDYLISGCSIN